MRLRSASSLLLSRVAHLEHPEARDQKDKDGDADVLETGDAPQRETGIVLREAAKRLLLLSDARDRLLIADSR